MPITKGDKSVVVNRALVEPLMQLHQSDAKDISFNKFVNSVLKDYVHKRQFIRGKFPALWTTAIQDNVVIIRDLHNERFVEVYLKDSELWCQFDKSKDCDHVHYVLSLPEAGRLEIKRPHGKQSKQAAAD